MNKKTNYIFSINTGRSGSDYLQNIFKNVSNCTAFHEPNPIGNGDIMKRFSKGDLKSMKEFTQEKIEVIEELKGNYQLYVETNHCFIKGFGWYAPMNIPEENIGVIILTRNKSKVVESLLRIGCSPLNKLGRKWISTPDMSDPIVMPPNIIISAKITYQCIRLTNLFFFSGINLFFRKILRKTFHYPKWFRDYELDCLNWYVDEINAYADIFKRKYPNIKYYEVSIEDLNSYNSVKKMLLYFGCSWEKSLLDIVGNPTNLKRSKRITYNT